MKQHSMIRTVKAKVARETQIEDTNKLNKEVINL